MLPDSKSRLLTAIEGGCPDRLPATTHHLMPSFLLSFKGGMDEAGFWAETGLDPIRWRAALLPDPVAGVLLDESHEPGPHGARRLVSDAWRITETQLDHPSYRTVRVRISTPGGNLDTVLQSDAYTTWVLERPVKTRRDIELIARHAPALRCDTRSLQPGIDPQDRHALLRGAVPGFDVYGQPGCWQDAAAMFGIEELILATYDDPAWVHEFLGILLQRKLGWTESLAGAPYDLIELGGGDASATVISPALFEEFVAPYDARLIESMHGMGQRTVYHICGGIMPLLGPLADMRPRAIETFTPSEMGGDANLAEAKRMLAGRVSMIGGFNQNRFFRGAGVAETKREVRRCFEEAGEGGGYILCPSDHFFEADPELLRAFAEEAAACLYEAAS